MFYMKVPVSLLYNTFDQAMASVLLLCNKLDTSGVVKDKAQPILLSAQPTLCQYTLIEQSCIHINSVHHQWISSAIVMILSCSSHS